MRISKNKKITVSDNTSVKTIFKNNRCTNIYRKLQVCQTQTGVTDRCLFLSRRKGEKD